METKQAILAFAQSEKVKSALLWCSQAIQIIQNQAHDSQAAAMQLLQSMVAMIFNEMHLGRQVSGHPGWLEAEKCLNNARIMIESGVPGEAVYHFTQALTQVNRVGQQSMTVLIQKGLLA